MFRSRPVRPQQAAKMAAVAAVSICIIIPVLAGIVSTTLTSSDPGFEQTAMNQIALVAMLSPIVTLPVFVLAGPLAALAWARGIGGWASALILGTLTGVAVVVFTAGINEFANVWLQGVVFGTVFGLLTWAAGQIVRPRE